MVTANKQQLAGYIATEPKLDMVVQRSTGQEISKSEFTLAINSPSSENTDYFQVVAWRDAADNLVRYKKKGDPLYVEGELKFSSWTAEDGTKRSRIVIRADQIQYLPQANYTPEAVAA